MKYCLELRWRPLSSNKAKVISAKLLESQSKSLKIINNLEKRKTEKRRENKKKRKKGEKYGETRRNKKKQEETRRKMKK